MLEDAGGDPLAGIGGMLANISPWGIFWSLLFSTIGYIVYKRGRQRQDTRTIVCGVILMIYSYATPSARWTFIVGAGLCIWAYDLW